MTPTQRTALGALAIAGTSIALAAPAIAQGGAPDTSAIITNYANIAEAGYADSLNAALDLRDAVDAFLADPSEASLDAAKAAWIAAREPYQQTEVYRFGNPLVDEWEGRVNAWPLDEGLIDYVASQYGFESDVNQFYRLNVIANPTIAIGGREIDASQITPELLSGTLHEIGGVEANVATGYHAIEFLLWGQDLNGTGPGAGERPYTDYDLDNCTNGNCDRRADYLRAATDLLVTDLEEMVANWTEDGPARLAVEGDDLEGLRAIFMGLGSLAFGELAGERIKLGLLVHDPEEEHDCFSDNTYNSHYYDIVGIENVYYGRYERTDGSVVEGPSPAELLRATAPEIADEFEARLADTIAAASEMKQRGETVEAFDQMIAEGNDAGNDLVQLVVDSLVLQTETLEQAIVALDLGTIELERSDALDNPEAVF